MQVMAQCLPYAVYPIQTQSLLPHLDLHVPDSQFVYNYDVRF